MCRITGARVNAEKVKPLLRPLTIARPGADALSAPNIKKSSSMHTPDLFLQDQCKAQKGPVHHPVLCTDVYLISLG